ncbi:MAG: hypothetical protein ACE5G1_00940 [bacterium]
MAIVSAFNIPGMTSEQYDQTIKELEAAGAGTPDGRLYHVAAPTADGWFVTDVWESAEKFEKFGQTLMPILQSTSVTPVEPAIYQVHNIIKG